MITIMFLVKIRASLMFGLFKNIEKRRSYESMNLEVEYDMHGAFFSFHKIQKFLCHLVSALILNDNPQSIA